jgi:hypothetical protein
MDLGRSKVPCVRALPSVSRADGVPGTGAIASDSQGVDATTADRRLEKCEGCGCWCRNRIDDLPLIGVIATTWWLGLTRHAELGQAAWPVGVVLKVPDAENWDEDGWTWWETPVTFTPRLFPLTAARRMLLDMVAGCRARNGPSTRSPPAARQTVLTRRLACDGKRKTVVLVWGVGYTSSAGSS